MMQPSAAAAGRDSSMTASAIKPRPAMYVLGILLIWAAIYIPGLFTPALLDDADSVHAEAAREMLLRHDWVTLYADGIRYLEKAPLMYWGMALSFKLFGVTEWTARLPLALAALALLLATFQLGRRAFGSEGGFYSALALGTSFGVYIFTRFQIPEVLVALWLTMGFVFFLRGLGEEPPSRTSCWGLAVVTALNVLTKGLIGLVFPGTVIFIFLLLTGRLRHLFRMRLLSSAMVFLAVAAPWHILAAIRNPTQGNVRGFLWFYFVNEHFLRYLNKRVPRDYDTVPLLIFWGLLLLWLMPWSAFLPQAATEIPIRLKNLGSKLGRREQANLLFAIWAAVIVVFFSFSTRQEYYTIPAIPGLALLIGGWLAREREAGRDSRERRAGRISALVLFALGVAAFAAGVFLLISSRTPPAGGDLAALLKRNPDEYALSFGHIFDLTPQALGAFREPLLATTLALFFGTVLNWVLRRRGTPAQGNLALVGMMVVVLLSVHAALVTFAPILSSKQLALAIKKHYQPGDVIVVAGEYEQGSTLNFYTGVPVHILHQRSANLWYGSSFPDAPQIFETQESFTRLWNGAARIFLWSDEMRPKALQGLTGFELARYGGKYIFTNQPIS